MSASLARNSEAEYVYCVTRPLLLMAFWRWSRRLCKSRASAFARGNARQLVRYGELAQYLVAWRCIEKRKSARAGPLAIKKWRCVSCEKYHGGDFNVIKTTRLSAAARRPIPSGQKSVCAPPISPSSAAFARNSANARSIRALR